MLDAQQLFGMPDEEETPGCQVLDEMRSQLSLSGIVEIDHDVTAKNGIKLVPTRMRRLGQVQTIELDPLPQFGFYAIIPVPGPHPFLKVAWQPGRIRKVDPIALIDRFGRG